MELPAPAEIPRSTDRYIHGAGMSVKGVACPSAAEFHLAIFLIVPPTPEFQLHLDNDSEDGLAVDEEDDEIGAVLGGVDVGEVAGLDACLGVDGESDAECMSEELGCEVRSPDGSSDASGPEGGMMRGIVDVFAQYEREVIRARTRAALAVKKTRMNAWARSRTASASPRTASTSRKTWLRKSRTNASCVIDGIGGTQRRL
jgi:hypothetical protein